MPQQQQNQEPKMAYVEPKLTTHGTVEETTQGRYEHGGHCSGMPIFKTPETL